MGVMNPAHRVAMGFHCQTQRLTNSRRLISAVSPPFSLDAYYSTVRVILTLNSNHDKEAWWGQEAPPPAGDVGFGDSAVETGLEPST